MLFSIVSGLLLAFSFASGILAINVFLGSKTFDSLTVSHESNCANHLIVNLNTGCGVCGDNQCKRQKSVKDNQPWLGLNIPKDVDQAIQDVSQYFFFVIQFCIVYCIYMSNIYCIFSSTIKF